MSADQFPSLSALLRQGMGDALSPAAHAFLDMLSEDIVFEFPFSLPDGIRALHGKDAVAAYLPKVAQLISIESMSLLRSILSKDGTTAVLEFSCKGYSNVNAARYDQDYVSVIELRDGLIRRYRDYWNPLIVMTASGSAHLANGVLKGENNAA